MIRSHKLSYILGLTFLILVAGIFIFEPYYSKKMGELDEQEVKDTINSYFSMRYKTLQSNEPLDFSIIFDGQEIDTTDWLGTERDKRDVEIFIQTIFEQYIIDYSYHLDFKTIEIDRDRATVELLEGNKITYENNPMYPSEMANIEHEITLIKTSDGWKVMKDAYSDDLTRLLKYSSKEVIFKNIQSNHDKYPTVTPDSEQITPFP
jgi:hypothetical protein